MHLTLVALLAAAAGAAIGALGTWWLQSRQNTRFDHLAVQAKLHELELRMVRLEAENLAYTRFGEHQYSPKGEQGHA